MRITAEQASARVRAALGRPAQDSLETAVVLEAWGGLVPPTALALSRGAIDRKPAASELVRPGQRLGEVTEVSTREVLGLIAALLATTAWVAPLTIALGGSTTDRAWKVALPISLALQWLLRRRHLNGPEGLARLRGDRPVIVTAAVAYSVTTVGIVVDTALMLPAALVLTWVGGLLIVVRGWGLPYAVALVGATVGLNVGVPVVIDILFVVDLTGLLLVAALLTTPPTQARPTPWRRSLPAGLIGGITALLIVIDPSVEWSSSQPFPVIALMPSLLASIWAGRYLNRIWTVLLRALATTGLLHRRTRPNWRVFAEIVFGAFGRLILATSALSVLAFGLLVGSAGSSSQLARLLIGLGAFGLVNFLAALLESLSRLGGALVVAVAAVAAAQWALTTELASLRQGSLIVAAVAAFVVGAIPIYQLIRQPDRTIATLFS